MSRDAPHDQNTTVLTASRRLAHALRLDYALHAQGQGLTVWRTPLILPWSSWLRQQWLERRGQQQDARPSRLLNLAQARVLWSDIVAASPVGEALLNPSNAARLAARSWQRLHDYLLEPEQLTTDGTPESQALRDWCSEFRRRCDALDALDEARLAAWAWEARLAPDRPLSIAGFDMLTPAMRRLLARWQESGLAMQLDAAPAASAKVRVITALDAADELELAARWARARVEAGGGRVGVVIGDLPQRRAEVQRTFEDVFAPAARGIDGGSALIPVDIAAPEPLAAWPIVDAALLVLRLAAGEGDSTLAGRLLRSPFIAAGDSERDARALADFRLRKEQRDRWDWPELERWAGMNGCPQLLLAARDVGAALRASTTSARASLWAERFHRILRAAGWPGERTPDSIEFQTVGKFQAALAELGALDTVLRTLSLSAALNQLRELLHETPFEPETPPAVVTVIDAATAAGMQFDALWVTGVDAARVPGPVAPDPLIPLALQRAAGIPDASPELVLQQAQVRLNRWAGSAAEVVFSWPQREADAQLQPSPLLAAWPAQGRETLSLHRVRPLSRSLFEQRPQLQTVADDRAPPVRDPQSMRGGASILEQQSQCPFRAQAQLRLYAEPLSRVGLGIEQKDRGTLLHRVLQDLWSELRDQRGLLERDAGALAARVRQLAEKRAAQTLRPTSVHRGRLSALEIESVVGQILLLLAIERQRAPFAVRLAEAKESVELAGLMLALRPDRLDALEAGGELLVDYKLGPAHQPRHWLDVWPGRPWSPQLPLYALAHGQPPAALAFVVIAPGAVEYRGWSQRGGVAPGVGEYPSGLRLRPADPPDWPSLLQHWRHTLTGLAEQFIAGEADVDPLPRACDYCHLSTLCRINERGHTDSDEAPVDE